MKATALAVSLVALFASFGASAAQGEGKVSFKGMVIDAPCGISPESQDQTIDFGQVSKATLAAAGGKSEKKLAIKLINCDATKATNGVKVTFSGGLVSGTATELPTSGSTNTAIKISGYGKDVEFGKASDAVLVVDGQNTLEYTASLVQATGKTVAEGEFTAVSNFGLSYP
ncbi:fimbrial protein [Enterobacter asburiae]|uniref:fimbrial protein n=1 Tax=Enterobacter asburiae TaxID=61645 RepID=UPI002966154A|nr:fimbrial protein [Enterobacter asburiae]MDW3577819.1 type 1 fimbrial protein [Enterobacter asburiae]